MTRARDVADTQDNVGGSVPPFLAGKNKIINGDFGIWQRGTSFNTNGAFTADRWKIGFGGTGTAMTTSQQSFTLGSAPVAGYESQYFIRSVVTGGSGTSSLAVIQQPVEDVRAFAGQTVTLSFWAKASTGTPSIGIDLYQEFGSSGSPSGTVSNGGTKVAITTSWARYSATISIASIAGKTITTNSLLGVRLWFSSGSDYNSLNGTLGIQSNTFDIWGVQLEAGSVATPFTTATGTIQGELAACQRYYFRLNATKVYTRWTNGIGQSGTSAQFVLTYPVQMRALPTSLEYSNLAVYDTNAVTAVTGATFDDGGVNSTYINATVASGLTQYRPYQLIANNSAAAYIGLSAEL